MNEFMKMIIRLDLSFCHHIMCRLYCVVCFFQLATNSSCKMKRGVKSLYALA